MTRTSAPDFWTDSSSLVTQLINNIKMYRNLRSTSNYRICFREVTSDWMDAKTNLENRPLQGTSTTTISLKDLLRPLLQSGQKGRKVSAALVSRLRTTCHPRPQLVSFVSWQVIMLVGVRFCPP